MRGTGMVGLVAAAVVLAGCTSSIAGTPVVGDPTEPSTEQSPDDSGAELVDALLPESELPPGEDYMVVTELPPGAGELDPALVSPPECRRLVELNNDALAGATDFATRGAGTDGGPLTIALLRGDLVDFGELRDALEACPRYTVSQGDIMVSSDQRILPSPGVGAERELYYKAVTSVGPTPTADVTSLLLRDGDEQITVNVPAEYADEVVPLGTAQLELKREILD